MQVIILTAAEDTPMTCGRAKKKKSEMMYRCAQNGIHCFVFVFPDNVFVIHEGM